MRPSGHVSAAPSLTSLISHVRIVRNRPDCDFRSVTTNVRNVRNAYKASGSGQVTGRENPSELAGLKAQAAGGGDEPPITLEQASTLAEAIAVQSLGLRDG